MPRKKRRQPKLIARWWRNGGPTPLGWTLLLTLVFFTIGPPPWVGESAHAIDINQLINNAETALAGSNDSLAQIWRTQFLKPGPAFRVVVWLSSILGGVLLIGVMFRWLKYNTETDGLEGMVWVQLDLIWVLLLILSLQFNGRLMGAFVYGENTLVDKFLADANNYIQADIKFRNAMALTGMGNIMAPQIKQCEGKVGQGQIECMANVRKEGEKIFSGLGGSLKASESWLDKLKRRFDEGMSYALDSARNPLDAAATAFWAFTSPNWTPIVNGIMQGFAEGVFFVIDILLIGIAFLGPLSLAFSLLPVPHLSKMFFAWQSGMGVLWTWKFLLTILNGVAADIMLSVSSPVNTLWFGFATGIILPLVTLVIAVVGGFQLFGTLVFAASALSAVASGSGGGGDSGGGGGSSPPPPPSGRSASSANRIMD